MLKVSMVVMSISLFTFSLIWGKILGFWVCLEMAGLVLLVIFFILKNKGFNRFLGVLLYLLVAGLSSGFLFSGCLMKGPDLFIYFSFVLKSGIFPFMSWLMPVYTCCSWLLFWLIAVMSKVTILYVGLLGICAKYNFLLSITFMVVAIFIWISKFGMKSFLAYSGMASMSLLIAVVFNGDVVKSYYLYLLYAITYSVNVLMFYILENNRVLVKNFISMLFLLVAIPFSLMFFYKLFGVICSLNIGLFILVPWISFGVLEQAYLIFYCMEKVGSFKG